MWCWHKHCPLVAEIYGCSVLTWSKSHNSSKFVLKKHKTSFGSPLFKWGEFQWFPYFRYQHRNNYQYIHNPNTIFYHIYYAIFEIWKSWMRKKHNVNGILKAYNFLNFHLNQFAKFTNFWTKPPNMPKHCFLLSTMPTYILKIGNILDNWERELNTSDVIF